MSLDPRTPVIVGVGQVLSRPDERLVEPLDLMAEALEAAARDVGPGGRSLLEGLDLLSSVASFVWHPKDPSLLVASRLGIEPRATQVTATGGSLPSKLVAQAATAIAESRLDAVGIVGAEAMASRGAIRKGGEREQWASQGDEVAPAFRLGEDRLPLTELEISRGITAPVSIYPLFENAQRAAQGWSLEEHREQLGSLWSSFSAVAAENPMAWIPEHMDADAITLPSPTNRMIAEPYTKLMVANLPVDMGAGLLMCSVERARSLGVDESAMVFPWAHVVGEDPFFISERPELQRSVALELIAPELLGLAGVDVDDVGLIDLYSCFPIAVQMGAQALGISLDDARPLTVTGGLTFGGGPGNNYVTHSLATMVERLRSQPGELGLVSGLSYFATSHAMGIYSTTPPPKTFRSGDVQQAIDALPTQVVSEQLEGEVVVETYTISHDREAGPVAGTFAVRDAAGTRSWATVSSPDELMSLAGTELIGATGRLSDKGTLALR